MAVLKGHGHDARKRHVSLQLAPDVHVVFGQWTGQAYLLALVHGNMQLKAVVLAQFGHQTGIICWEHLEVPGLELQLLISRSGNEALT